MNLTELFDHVDHKRIGSDVDIRNIEYDSRRVKPGDLFACIVGSAADGHQFAQNAIDNGAVALLVERQLPFDITQIVASDTRIAMAEAACRFYDNPSRKMTMVGITGTNGKTTTTYMVRSILEEVGKKVGLIGTITNSIGDTVIPTERTTPDSVDLQRLLARMVEEKVDVCVMEVSSHALDQKRVYGIEFDVGAFTNLTQDHLDYHKTKDAYRQAKKLLFKQSKSAVINRDDLSGEYMQEELTYPVRTIGIRENTDITAKEIDITPEGVRFDLVLPEKETTHIRLNIPGLFSVYNAMCAAGITQLLGSTTLQIKRGLDSISSVSGRLEKLPVGDRKFTIFLDYAHTPDAMENILKTVRGFARGRIVTLFGCGGNRDRAKRQIMGEVAGRYSDYCIITSDNPRNEHPMTIIRMVEEGVKKTGCDYAIIENRREAIRFALETAKADDILILAGKGHETYQEINGQKNHFDEKEVVAELIAEMDQAKAAHIAP